MSEATVYANYTQPFTVVEFEDLLSNVDPAKISHAPPVRPEAGSVYVFVEDISIGTLRRDQYQWVTDGARLQPKNCPTIKRHHFIFRTEEGKDTRFRKH